MGRGDRAALIGEFVELALQFEPAALPWFYWLVLGTKRRRSKRQQGKEKSSKGKP